MFLHQKSFDRMDTYQALIQSQLKFWDKSLILHLLVIILGLMQ